MACANNKGRDRSGHRHILISAFVVGYLDSIILSKAKIARLASLCSHFAHPKDRFSHGVAQMFSVSSCRTVGFVLVSYRTTKNTGKFVKPKP